MRVARLVGAATLALCLRGAQPAGAMVKLCVAMPSVKSVVEVPAHPTIVVSRGAVESRGDRLFRTFTGYKGSERVPDRPLRYTVEKIDDDNVRAIVDATEGMQFFAGSVVGASCSGVTYKVVPNVAAVDDRGIVFTGAKTYLIGEDDRQWALELGAELHRTWTRVEWAYDIATVESGRGTVRWEDEAPHGKVFIETPPDRTALFMKVTRYNVDGTISLTRNKLTRHGDAITIEGVPQKP